MTVRALERSGLTDKKGGTAGNDLVPGKGRFFLVCPFLCVDGDVPEEVRIS